MNLATEASAVVAPFGLFVGLPVGEVIIEAGMRLWLFSISAPVATNAVVQYLNATITVDAGTFFTIDGSSVPNCPQRYPSKFLIAGAQRYVVMWGPPDDS